MQIKTKIEHKYHIVLLYSGGLDSILSAKILLEQGISVLGVKFMHPFFHGIQTFEEKFYYEKQIGINILELPTDNKYIKTIIEPQYGYGSQANPCIDCKIYFLRKGWELAQQISAVAIATGEVPGQRPFSQRSDAIKLIEKRSRTVDRIIRPLSGKLFPQSKAERDGIVNSEKLYSISGRSRAIQLKLAKKFGVTRFESIAGGCILTDPGYAKRFLEAREHNEINIETTQLLKIGRHIRINGKRVVVGRNQKENEILENSFSTGKFFLINPERKGPVVLVDGSAEDKTVIKAAEILARYTNRECIDTFEVRINAPTGVTKIIIPNPANPIWVDKLLIKI
jgi:tRNA U34 2-thiouridine synthase MnmA/TrmU